jgi:hypothetical protein
MGLQGSKNRKATKNHARNALDSSKDQTKQSKTQPLPLYRPRCQYQSASSRVIAVSSSAKSQTRNF